MTLVAELDAEPDETVAGTTHGAGGADTESIESPATPLAVPRAWELDEDETSAVGRPWGDAWRRAGVIVIGGVLVATFALAVFVIGGNRSGNQTKPFPTIGTTTAAPPAAVVPAIIPPTPTPAAPPEVSPAPEDERFLAMLARDGVPRPVSVPDAVAAAADVCRMVSHGDDYGYIESWMRPPHGKLTQDQAEAFLADALSAYCPHAAIPPAAVPAPARTPSTAELDQHFLADLNAGLAPLGMSVSDPAGSVSDGLRVCGYIAAGHTVDQTIDEVVVGLPANVTPGKARAIAQAVVVAAVRAYCPQSGG
jgi:hypothetical protein